MMLFRELALLAKNETTYASDAAPTAPSNAVLARNVVVTPLAVARESRDLYKPFFGNTRDVIAGYWTSIRFEVECAGAGTLGGIPGYGPLLRACGFAEINEPGVRTLYKPVTRNLDSATFWAFLGGVRHRARGVRGNVGLRWVYRQVPVFVFDMVGLFVPVDAVNVPADVSYAQWQTPLAINQANTSGWQFHGVADSVLHTLTVDMGNQVSYRNLVGDESVRLGDRKPVGTVQLGGSPTQVRDWINTTQVLGAEGQVQVTHGVTGGNVVDVVMPKVQIVDSSYVEFEGDRMLSAQLKVNPEAGNDEIYIIAR